MTPRYRSPLTVASILRARAGGSRPVPASTAGMPNSLTITWLPSASDGLHRLLLEQSAGGSIILPAYTCMRVVGSVVAAGWTPKFVDIEPHTLTMSATSVAAALGNRRPGTSAAVLVTHLHGLPAPLRELRVVAERHGAILIEDCAMAQGARCGAESVGAGGDASLFSFGLGKTISIGAGGAVVGRRVDSAPAGSALVSPLRTWLSRAGRIGDLRFATQETVKTLIGLETRGAAEPPYLPTRWRKEALSALPRLLADPAVERTLDVKRALSAGWLSAISDLGSPRVSVPTPADSAATPCCPGVPLFVTDRDRLAARLRELGVHTSRLFSYSAGTLAGAGRFPGADWLAARILLLPTEEGLSGVRDSVLTAIADA